METRRLENTTYHSLLRIAVGVFALVLVFDSGLISEQTKKVSQGTIQYVASAISVGASVSPNDVNILTARITELEQEVVSKDRQIAVRLNTEGGQTTNTSTLILSFILFILLLLIVTNYILDYLRQNSSNYQIRISSKV